jgi:hypothetical protein
LSSEQKLRPATRTVLTIVAFVTAMIDQWNDKLGVASANFAAMLWAKYMAETSNLHCYNFNIGNVKSSPNDGFDYHALAAWEAVPKGRADALVAAGVAEYETNEARKKAAPAGHVVIRFNAKHQASRFRAYDSLDEAMHAHLELLATRFSAVVPAMHAGDVEAFARAMYSAKYMTASPESYARAMRPHFGPARRTPEIAAIDLEDVEPTEESIIPIHGSHAVDASHALREEMLRERWG